ncbi:MULTISPECIES: cytochrome P450 [Saccharopolyspora]|uniref:Cytochrome P450 n=1 Tax=Saccharopolyspora gregorii TaxID=33914 RepID=A0ABP6RQW1_9PSEU|nr:MULTISPECIES: cytochrome P450 [unclassified Saccharopolyspora]MCA1190753.1 cytochrome P450 [Saccharopolyspora sp. 6V]MCA1278217.1 cytochrome P450 [Saccharopolyspora sp. 7B]
MTGTPVRHPTTRSRPFDPHDGLRELRAAQPLARLHHSDGRLGWLVTSHELAREVLVDHRFSSSLDVMRGPADGEDTFDEVPPGLFSVLPAAEHAWYRRKLAAAFAPRRVQRLEPLVADVVERRLDAVEAAGGPVDLVEVFASPVAFEVIGTLLGARLDRTSVRAATESMLALENDAESTGRAWGRLWTELHEQVRAKRAAPGDDLVSALLADEDLSDEEIATMCSMLITGGDDTTANMLGLGTYALLAHPEQLAALRADPAMIDTAVEELLRYLTINQFGATRTALEDVDLRGSTIREGEPITVSLSAANRDPERFPEPDRLDLGRPATGHLAFGHGIHHCLGAQLARVELRLGFSGLLRRFPGLRLAVPAAEVPLREASVNYGVHRLPVTW